MDLEAYFDIDDIIKRLLLPVKDIELSIEEISKILVRVDDIFQSESTLIQIDAPVIVVGSDSN